MRRGRLRRLAGRLRRRRPQGLDEVSDGELREFLEGAPADPPAAAEFQERLRRRLWAELERTAAGQRPERSD